MAEVTPNPIDRLLLPEEVAENPKIFDQLVGQSANDGGRT